jgi:Arc/MetJ-type ribon-helix-helix transcriptional regulator
MAGAADPTEGIEAAICAALTERSQHECRDGTHECVRHLKIDYLHTLSIARYCGGMTVELKPSVEALVERRIRSGAYSSPEEVIEHALEVLDAEEEWLSDEIGPAIQEGWGEAQRGELTDAEVVRAEMGQFKKDWEKRRQTA